MDDPILLVLGAGPNIGLHVAREFRSRGFRVALAGRRRPYCVSEDGRVMDLAVNLEDPSSIKDVFDHVRYTWDHPSVVVYNAALRSAVNSQDPFELSVEEYGMEMMVNATGAFCAAKLSVEGFKSLPPSPLKTFFYTGNKLNVMPSPGVMSFGMGRNAVSHMIWDASIAYRDDGYKFYYTDERFRDGKPTRAATSGEARSLLYLKLAEDPKQAPWHYTFVKGSGYHDFRSLDAKEYGVR